jgi:hypothetical protein
MGGGLNAGMAWCGLSRWFRGHFLWLRVEFFFIKAMSTESLGCFVSDRLEYERMIPSMTERCWASWALLLRGFG